MVKLFVSGEIKLLKELVDGLLKETTDHKKFCQLQSINQKLCDMESYNPESDKAMHWFLKIPKRIKDGVVDYDLIVKPTDTEEWEVLYFDQWCGWEQHRMKNKSLPEIARALYVTLKKEGLTK